MATAVGDLKSVPGVKKSLCVMAAQSSATTPPSTALDGQLLYPTSSNYKSDDGAFFGGRNPYRSTLTIHNSAGNGSLTGIFTLYVYLIGPGVWFPIKVNSGNAITGTNTIRYTETFLYNLGEFDRVFLDVQSPGGTSQQFEGWLTTPLENN